VFYLWPIAYVLAVGLIGALQFFLICGGIDELMNGLDCHCAYDAHICYPTLD